MNATSLIALLKEVEADESIEAREYLTNIEPVPPSISKVLNAADSVLITKKGQCDWFAIAVLKRNGYRVTAGEQDSHGWLSGCIHTSKGIIVYG